MAADLTGRTIIITGASAGIGWATALEAARAGMRVVVAARRESRLDELVRACEELGGEALAIATDVTKQDEVTRLVERTVERFGRVDVMLANAGLGHFAPLLETHPVTEQRMWDVNYHGSIHCARAAAAVMKQQDDRGYGRGHILLTSSVVGRTGLPYYGVYAATKAAQHAAAAALRLELEPDRIHVTGIYPGGTSTEFFDVVADEAGVDALSKNTPRIFMQTPQHVGRKIIKTIRRPRPELWPSRMTRLGMVLWTVFPRLYTLSFRQHAKKCRREIRRLKERAEHRPERE